MKFRSTTQLLATLGGLIVWAASAASPAAAADASEPDMSVFARVNGTVISAHRFLGALRAGVRDRFYHGQVPAEEVPKYQREVGTDLIDRELISQAARQFGVAPDPAWVERRLQHIEKRFQHNQRWPEQRDKVLPMVRAQLEQDSVVEQVEKRVRDVAAPTPQELRAYFAANPDKFTEPQRFRVSAILLKVDPSSSRSVWDAARHEAAGIVERLRAGADFAEMARLHSGDASGQKGGDLGYLHRGMLGEPAQLAVDAAALGETTDPVALLEGVGIFRVDERPPARLLAFDEARERAANLWLRERRETAWSEFVQRLREAAEIHVNERHYLPLAGADEVARM